MDPAEIYSAVSERYGALAAGPSKASEAYGKTVAAAFGYTPEELDDIPAGANLGLSCGNPLAMASLRKGETVVDLGCGGGFDVFLAARRVGPTGRAVGIDMNPAMLSLARANLAKAGTPPNIDFVESRITAVALPAGVADVVVSNCVVNLVPEGEKQAVFGEMFRLLRPGGRVAVSDVLARKTLPEGLLQSAAAHVACVGGASLVSEYATYLEKAGFIDIVIRDTKSDLNVYFDTMSDGTRRTREDGDGARALAAVCCSPGLSQSCGPPKPRGGGSCGPPKKDAPGQETGCCGPRADTAVRESSCCGPAKKDEGQAKGVPALEDLADIDLNEWVGSFNVFAVKP